MAKTKQQKKEQVKNLEESLKKIKGGVFANFDGLKVDEVEELRKRLREADSKYIVIKRTLLKIALKGIGLDIDVGAMPGGLSLAVSEEDEVMPAKTMAKFAKEHGALKITGGILENKLIDATKVEELSKLPTRDELLARVVGSIRAPVSGLVNVLQGNIRSLAQVLNAIRASRV